MRTLISVIFAGFVITGNAEEPLYKDFNFDGHPDKMIFSSKGGGPYADNVEYDIFLCVPEKKTYELNQDLSELCNPDPDPKQKTVTSRVRAGRTGKIQVFKWQQGRLLLIEEVTIQSVDGGLRETKKRLKKGRLRIVSSVLIPD